MSNHLVLRTMEKTDLPFIHALYNNPDIISYWFEEPYLSMTQLDDLFDKNKKNSQLRQFILGREKECIGLIELVNIDPRHRNAEFTIMIAPEYQGNGYAKIATRLALDYAFLTLNLHKLYLFVDTINEKAIHVYEQRGFQQEGVAREMFFVGGTYRDAAFMSILDRDYQKMDPQP